MKTYNGFIAAIMVLTMELIDNNFLINSLCFIKTNEIRYEPCL